MTFTLRSSVSVFFFKKNNSHKVETIKCRWYAYTMEYCSAMENHYHVTTISDAATWIGVKDIMLGGEKGKLRKLGVTVV